MKNGEEAGLTAAFMDRLKLTPARIRDMADGHSRDRRTAPIRSAR